MTKSKKWTILYSQHNKTQALTTENMIEILLQNRNITTKEQREEFLHSKLSTVTPQTVGIDKKQLHRSIKRIFDAIENKEKIVVFGDYDVDGITGTAILWETLYALGAKVIPYIPHRIDEGYGLSKKGIENCKLQIENCSLIITVDNGIVANEAVEFAREQGIDIIITDHHTVGKELPHAFAIVHTTKVCGAAVAYLLSETICHEYQIQNAKYKIPSDHLALVALATIADLVPLQGENRTLLIHGLEVVKTTTRPGLVALCEEAKILQKNIDVYTIGHVIGPRLNAMGRMESAMDSLRLLCTKDRLKAKVLAEKLGITNKDRQLITQSLSEQAKSSIINHKSSIKKLLFVANSAYEEGVIGLVAGKLVEEFYRPAIVLSVGEKISKASARSVAGFNIIEFIRSASDLLINAGGHPMAAGFTIQTEKITLLQELLEKLAEEQVDGDMLVKSLKIDCELPLEYISPSLYTTLQTLAPFGMANPEPTFSSKVVVKDIRTVGQEGKHLKLRVTDPSPLPHNPSLLFPAIGFGLGEYASKIKVGDSIDIAYTIDENIWQGNIELQLKVKDLKLN